MTDNPYRERYEAALAEIRAIMAKYDVYFTEDYGNSYMFIGTASRETEGNPHYIGLDLATMKLGE